jgi:mono/diheme cytochrome c family protein
MAAISKTRSLRLTPAPARRFRAFSRFSFACAFTLFSILLCRSAVASSAQSSGKTNSIAAATNHKVALVDSGRIVFNQRCEICHFVDSRARKIGPGLKDLFARSRLSNGTRITESSVAGIISAGGKDMPGYGDLLKPGQLQAVIAYLKSH